MSATITYKGEIVETLNGGEYVTLHTKDKALEDDIRVEVAEVSGGGDIAINGIVEQYKVNAGATVNAGDFVEFVNKYGGGTFYDGAITDVSACKLDNSRVLVVYVRTDSTTGNAVILSIDNNKIAVGEAITIASTSIVSVSALSNNKAIVSYYSAYTDVTGAAVRNIYAIVLEIDGATITKGKAKNISEGRNPFVTALTENEAIVAYISDNIYAGTTNEGVHLRVLNIDGTDITVGAITQVYSGYFQLIHLARQSENTALLAVTFGNSDKLFLFGLSISGTNITFGSPLEYPSPTYTSGEHYFTVVALSAKVAMLIWRRNAMYATLVGVTGTVLTEITRASIESDSSADFLSSVALTDRKVLVTFYPVARTRGEAVVLTVVGESIYSINVGQKVVFDINKNSCYSVIAFSPTSALVAYNNGTGAYATLSIDGDTITADSAEIGTYVQPATSRLHNVGVAKTSGTEGETVDVYCV